MLHMCFDKIILSLSFIIINYPTRNKVDLILAIGQLISFLIIFLCLYLLLNLSFKSVRAWMPRDEPSGQPKRKNSFLQRLGMANPKFKAKTKVENETRRHRIQSV